MFKLIPAFFVCCLTIFNSFGQDYDLTISEKKKEITGISYLGYSTSFEVGQSKLQKAWWKHTKKFGVLDNMRSHYVLKIPTSDKTLLPISLIQTTEGTDSTSTLFLAVFDQTNNSYKKQVRSMLLEFKVQFYVMALEEKIQNTESQLADVGASYQSELLQEAKMKKKGLSSATDNSHKEKLIKEITRLTYELEELKRELIEVR